MSKPILAHIPLGLRPLPQWVVWRYEEREGKRTKLPYRPHPQHRAKAKANDPATWGTLEAALTALETHKMEGLGFVFAQDGGIVGVDLDWKGHTGEGIPLEAQTVIDRLNSYTEWSPSRKGAHILLRGHLPPGVGNRKELAPGVELEVYDQGRYFTMTGERWEGYPQDLEDRQSELEALLLELFPPKVKPSVAPRPTLPVDLDDGALLERMFAAKNGAGLRRLWEGDTSGYPSQSEADLALASSLMWWCGNDRNRADALFRKSGLYREKWDAKHYANGKTYGEATLERAYAPNPYDPQKGKDSTGGEDSEPLCPLDGRTGGGVVLGKPRYRIHRAVIEHGKVERGEKPEVSYYPLANFAAVITREIRRSDGLESELWFELQGYAGAHPLPPARVKAAEFVGLNWVTREWGSQAVVTPGQGAKDHLRAAIQYLSTPHRATVYAHTGWVRLGERWVYLHATGGIASGGAVEGLEVDLPPALSSFTLPPTGGDARALLRLLDAAPRGVTWPLLLYALGAAINYPDGSLYLAGPTGAGKTTLALLFQSLWGHAGAPPASWEATVNSLEGLAFTAKDALLLVDDYAPTGHEGKQKELQAKAARLLRSQGNSTGRLRMRADGGLRPDRPPRGSLLVTGEDLPPGHSVRARTLVLELRRGELNYTVVTELQRTAREGVLASAFTGWLLWLAGRLDEVRERVIQHRNELRALYPSAHGRTTDAVARLHTVWKVAREYLAHSLREDELEGLEAEVSTALAQVAQAQADYLRDADPAERFLPLLLGLLESKRAHLGNVDEPTEPPSHPERWGWTWQENLSGHLEAPQGRWMAQGPQVGWLDGEDVLLNPEAAYAALNRLAAEAGEPLPTPRTLWKRLGERGIIRTQVEGGDVRYLVRARIGGRLHRVAHILGSYIAKTGNTGNKAENNVQGEGKPVPGSLSVPGNFREQIPHAQPPIPQQEGVFPVISGNKIETGNNINPVQDEEKPSVPGVPGSGDTRAYRYANEGDTLEL